VWSLGISAIEAGPPGFLPVPAQQQLRLVAAIRQESWRSGFDRGDAQGPDLRQHALRFQLVSPTRHIAHAPRSGRDRDAQTRLITPSAATGDPPQRASKHGAEINPMLNARLDVRL